ncbi:NACHT domain-containing protein [Limnospira fusiformis NRMCF6962]
MNLGKEQQPQQVQRPWDMSVKVGEQRRVQLPPQTTILDVFDNPTISGKFLILGKPGGGKTTTLLELAEALLERAEGDSNAPIPVILELSSWQEVTKPKFLSFGKPEKYDPSIKEWVLSQLISKGVSQDIGEQWLREKELVLLLDGLDELQPERQGKCVRAINQFLGSEFSPLHLVVCSRKEEYEVYEEMLQLNGAICLEDLTNEQIRDYFASVNLGEFWETIKGSEKIVDFIRQPLFLAVTSLAYEQIDVEEWRNCNTEKRAIDYLLGVYRVENIIKKDKIKGCSFTQLPESKIIQNRLVKIAKVMTENKLKYFNFSVINLELMGSELQRKIVNRFSALPYFVFPLICVFVAHKNYLFTNLVGQVSFVLYILFWFVDFYWFLCIGFIVFTISSGISYIILTELKVHNPSFAAYVVYAITFNTAIIIIPGLIALINELFKEAFITNFENNITAKGAILKLFLNKFLIQFKKSIKIKSNLNEYWQNFDNPQQLEYEINDIFEQVGCGICFALLLVFLGTITSLPIVLINPFFTWVAKIIIGIIVAALSALLIGIAVLIVGIASMFGTKLLFLPIFIILTPVILLLLFPIVFLGTLGVELYNFSRRFILRLILGLTGQMPWNITRFLDYCTERLILQRVGNRYRFIHRLVQEHFANLEIQKE